MNIKYFKYLLWLVFAVALAMGVLVVIFETNVFVKHPGSMTTTSISLNDLTDGELGTGYLKLERYADTPIGVEYVRFATGDDYKFFSVGPGEIVGEELYFSIPHNAEQGTYKYVVVATINDVEYSVVKKYVVSTGLFSE